MMENGFNSRRSAAFVSIQKVSLLAKNIIIVAGLIFSGFAHASAETFTFSVSGGWWNDGGKPYGMSYSPFLYGSITVDPSILDYHNRVTEFSLRTGTKTWTLADLDTTYPSNAAFMNTNYSQINDGTTVTSTKVKTVSFDLSFKDSLITDNPRNYYSMRIASNNMFVLQEGGLDNACNNCVRVSNITTTTIYTIPTTAVPEPETYGMMLAGLGLVGFMAKRRKQLKA